MSTSILQITKEGDCGGKEGTYRQKRFTPAFRLGACRTRNTGLVLTRRQLEKDLHRAGRIAVSTSFHPGFEPGTLEGVRGNKSPRHVPETGKSHKKTMRGQMKKEGGGLFEKEGPFTGKTTQRPFLARITFRLVKKTLQRKKAELNPQTEEQEENKGERSTTLTEGSKREYSKKEIIIWRGGKGRGTIRVETK